MTTELSTRIGGSWRDPSGFVIRRGERIIRAIDDRFDGLYGEIEASTVWRDLGSRGAVVGTTRVEDPAMLHALRAEHPGYTHFLEHERLDPIVYPYEWSVSMLAAAGCLTLELERRLVEHGFALKDASPFNVQFVRGRPVFIDVTSIERPARHDVWYALGQFGRMFTLPLMLARYRGWDLRSYFVGELGGRSLEQVAESVGVLARWRPAFLLDLTLPLVLGRMAERRQARGAAGASPSRSTAQSPAAASARANPSAASRGATAQLANLRRLERKIARLGRGYRPRGTWAGYTATCTYDAAAEAMKKRLVGEFLDATRPARVLDLGSNTGDYSVLAAQAGARVIALDGDHDAIELLYRRLQREPADITPIVASLTAPSPGLGLGNAEREPLLARLGQGTVLALALLHHLLVTANLSLEAACDLLAGLVHQHLVLEFVPVADPMFQRLLQYRSDRFEWVTLERCKAAFGARFSILREAEIPGSERRLLFLEARG